MSILTQNYDNRLETMAIQRLPNSFEISITWHKGRQASAKCFVPFIESAESKRTCGWGYDKASTAFADVVNECNSVLAILVQNYEKIKELYGYRIDNGMLSLSGGVGLRALIDIFEHCGYKRKGHNEDYLFFERV